MKKKFLLTAGTAILALGVLTACGDKAEEAETPDATPDTEQQEDANVDADAEVEADAEDDAEGEDAADAEADADAEGEDAEPQLEEEANE